MGAVTEKIHGCEMCYLRRGHFVKAYFNTYYST